MSVLLETSVGDIVIDLYVDKAPRTCDNFLKLCAIKYYNECTFHTIRRDHSVQTGDPTNTGSGGQSVQGLLAAAANEQVAASRFVDDEIDPTLTHSRAGTVGMSNLGIPNSAASQFYITTAPALHSLDSSHTVFGQVAEGMDVLDRINAAVTDERGRPTVHIRIRHTAVLDDPFPIPDRVAALIPPDSPPPVNDPYDYENINASLADNNSAAAVPAFTAPALNPHAVVLEMISDLPSADVAPPDNVLFVCKLNPVTQDDDLQLIFSRFGAIKDCSIVRDSKTGASLCYAFIEYERKEQCEAAYVKMDNVLIDDRRIRVDFSQSVSRQWKQFARNKRSGTATHTDALATLRARQRVGPTTAPARENNTAATGGRKSRWGESRLQLPSLPTAEEREDGRSVEERGRERDARDGGEDENTEDSRDRQHRSERRHRSRERSSERARRKHSRSRSRSRDRHKHSRRDNDGDSRERHRERQEERDKQRQRDSRDTDERHKDRERHRRSHSPRRRNH